MIPAQLLKEAEAFWKNQNHEIDTNNDKACFDSGVEWLWDRLCEMSEAELDRGALNATARNYTGDRIDGGTKQTKAVVSRHAFFAGARHQHAIDQAALLKARERLSFAEEFIKSESGSTLDYWIENKKALSGDA